MFIFDDSGDCVLYIIFSFLPSGNCFFCVIFLAAVLLALFYLPFATYSWMTVLLMRLFIHCCFSTNFDFHEYFKIKFLKFLKFNSCSLINLCNNMKYSLGLWCHTGVGGDSPSNHLLFRCVSRMHTSNSEC